VALRCWFKHKTDARQIALATLLGEKSNTEFYCKHLQPCKTSQTKLYSVMKTNMTTGLDDNMTHSNGAQDIRKPVRMDTANGHKKNTQFLSTNVNKEKLMSSSFMERTVSQRFHSQFINISKKRKKI
jgi:hypothetical protein